ncbi:MAG: beta-lactamase family protein [Lachnospiraceae bacterium]|nr:beta-lactamase family protein [Lachnospiraceae bacterium]
MLTFEKTFPEETGIPSECIIRLTDRLQKRQLPMHSLLLMHRDKLVFEGYYAPLTAHSLHRMFSISKSFTSIAVGLLADEGRLSLTDPIIKYFPEKLPDKDNIHPWIAQMTIKDMLMMRSCHASTTYKLDMASDWVASFFATPPTHPPGTLFHYDTSAAHTLCALVEKLTGQNMLDYLKEKLHILGFSKESYMIKDPFGVSMGGSGLVALPIDMMKFGYFIAHRGLVLGEQLLSSSYIDMAVSPLTANCVTAPLPSEAQGYGLQFWRNEKNGFTCYGMGGQLIIFLPDYELICVTTADTQSVQGGNQQIYDALYEELLPYIKDQALPHNARAEKALNKTLSALAIKPLESTAENLRNINGKTFNVQNEASDFQSFSVFFAENAGTLSFTHKNTPYSVSFGMDSMQTGTFPIYNLWYAASGAWLFDGTLLIRALIIDAYVGSVQFQLSFQDDSLTIFMTKKEESLFHEFNGHLYCKMQPEETN